VRIARAVLFLMLVPLPMIGTLGGGCGGTRSNLPPDADTHPEARPIDVARIDGPYHPDASCLVTIDTPPLGPEIHVDEGSDIMFTSNPPAGGPHYPRWARWMTTFMQYPTPIPRGYWIHNLEHGGVVFLYKCDPDAGLDAAREASADGGTVTCAEAAEKFLTQAMNALPTDPLCAPPVRVRAIITPDPNIPTPFAAAAWGWTYTSACADLPTLIDFAKSHYAKAPEDFCSDGSYPP
jgi:hypothetical protein